MDDLSLIKKGHDSFDFVCPFFVFFSYTYGGSEYASPGPGTGNSGYYNHQAMTNYELSADYVDSTTAYDPRPTPTQVDAVAPDTPSVNAAGVIPNVVASGEYWLNFILIQVRKYNVILAF